MYDEGPSQEDLQRFGGEGSDTAFCPSCGAEVSDLATVCPNCLQPMFSGPDRHSPLQRALERRWFFIIVIVVMLALLWFMS